MGRMVRAYMHEEELRARHQATLLRLREDALQEKTKAHLEWLKVKKKALRKKGDDDKMPPLARMEKGLLKKFKQQQVSQSDFCSITLKSTEKLQKNFPRKKNNCLNGTVVVAQIF